MRGCKKQNGKWIGSFDFTFKLVGSRLYTCIEVISSYSFLSSDIVVKPTPIELMQRPSKTYYQDPLPELT